METTRKVRARFKRVTMRVVTRALVLATLLLAACGESRPDFEFVVASPHGERKVNVMGFQPRGTIEGYLLLSFGGEAESQSVATFREVTNGTVGWISDRELAIVGDRLRYHGVSSDYFPDGTVRSKVRLLICTRDEMDCSSLEARILNGVTAKELANFPES
jgi:hypothetical protein